MATRSIIDKLNVYLKDKPTSDGNATTRLEWVKEWAQAYPRPSTPEQDFKD